MKLFIGPVTNEEIAKILKMILGLVDWRYGFCNLDGSKIQEPSFKIEKYHFVSIFFINLSEKLLKQVEQTAATARVHYECIL